MGQNRRYGSNLSRAAVAASVLRPQPLTLSKSQVGESIREPTKPIPVVAWVQFPTAVVEVDGHAIAWTERAVCVKFRLMDNEDRTCWVWANAVRRQEHRG